MTKLEEALASLSRVQKFTPESLARKEDLGRLSFEAVVPNARRLIGLFIQLSPTALDDFPDGHLDTIKNIADAEFNRFQQILTFDPTKDGNPAATRDSLVNQVRDTYNGVFNGLYQFIAYGVSKSVDFRRMENDARASIQSVQDHAKAITNDLEKAKQDALAVLVDVRKAAAEQGVTQQATYFKEEADSHDKLAHKWQTFTGYYAIALAIFAVASLWIHHIPGLLPDSPMVALQLTTSKVLLFLVIAYMLLLSARNLLAHRHNAVVNRHRQNALMTFKALTDAAKNPDAKDIVLAHAAACIFAPQETGYSRVNPNPALSKSIIELLPKTTGAGQG